MENNVEDVSLDIEAAIPCGLIINELVTNSLKHAFPTKSCGTSKIFIDIHSDENNRLSMVVGDNGLGFPENLDFRHVKTLGLQLVNSLVNQLNGTIELDRSGGTKFKITFEKVRYKKRI